jgi:lipopolysaccharide transport system ATP-binding protein
MSSERATTSTVLRASDPVKAQVLDTPSPAIPPPQRDIVLRLEGVGKCYHIYDKPQDRLKQAMLRVFGKTFYRDFWALRDINLTLRKGEAVGVLGRNGSGKSTLLQIIAGTLSPSVGKVSVGGRIAALLELGSGFNPEFTGRENVYLNGAILGLTKAQVDERFDAIVDFADIGTFLDQPVKTYSSGMLVRLAFAVQVQVEPDILIVDEALAVGDSLFQKRCYQRLEELRDRGTSLLLVSHDLESIRTLTGRALLLHGGRAMLEASPGDVVLAYRKLLHEEEARWMRAHMPASSLAASLAGLEAGQEEAQKSFGDRDASITGMELLGADGSPQDLFHAFETMRVRITFEVHRELDKLNIGLRIRNKQGVKMYSWGTLNQDIAIWSGRAAGEVFWDRTFRAGDRCTIEFSCPCTLGVDTYEIQLALTQELDRYYNTQRMIHWRDEAAFFRVVQHRQEYFFGGVSDLRMTAHVVG